MELNRGFEYILTDDLNSDIQPITRLAAYLCLRYNVQALIETKWLDSERPIGFFDLLRNIRVITNEDDLQGLITMTIRVRPSLSDNKYAHSNQLLAIDEIPFDKVGAFWFVELVLLNIQNEQRADMRIQANEIDFGHPLISAFNLMGLKYIEESEFGDIEFRPIKTPVSVDEVMMTFVREKPGAKTSSITVWNNN